MAGRDNIATPKVRKNHLLAICIDEYENCPELYNCVKDGESFIQLVQQHFRFLHENIQFISNKKATQANIIKAFRQIAASFTEEDNLIVYYSGHGLYDKVLDEGYWIPVDAEMGNNGDYISNAEIIKFLKAIKAHHIVLIIDSCFSGTLAQYKNLEGLERAEEFPSRWLLTSGRQEPVLDGKPGDHSPFAEGILDYLKRHKKDNVLISNLIQYVKTAVARNVEQIPLGSPLHGVGDKGGEFVFHSIAQPLPVVKVIRSKQKGKQDPRPSDTDQIPFFGKIPGKRRRALKYILLALSVFLIAYYIPPLLFPKEGTNLYPFISAENQKYGYKNEYGRVILEPIYDDATYFSFGMAAVALDQKYGFINKKGETVIDFQYQDAGAFGSELAPVRMEELYGYIDTDGQQKIDFLYKMAGPFQNGKAQVSLDGSRYFYINPRGEETE